MLADDFSTSKGCYAWVINILATIRDKNFDIMTVTIDAEALNVSFSYISRVYLLAYIILPLKNGAVYPANEWLAIFQCNLMGHLGLLSSYT